ncbi:hypothetical protein F6455_02835 [Proteobacteria bacterium 005FR1]|nr:hypothetical protein [Proteobacteria bacterium 005FR1]
MECNPEIFKIASGHLKIAECAEKQSIEIDEFYHAYKANLAFSIELFLKSLDATSTERLILKVGDARITRLFAESNLREHDLKKLFDGLENGIKSQLQTKFRDHECNISGQEMDDVLSSISGAFIKDRYAYESGGVTESDPEILLWTSRFFYRELNSGKI